MIQIEEIRIGNTVKRRFKDEELCVDLKLFNSISRSGIHFKGVPLTKEKLLQAGFKKEKHSDVYLLDVWDHHKIIMMDGVIYLECEDSFYTKKLKHIKSLHNLQNLVQELTGNKLKFKSK